jgi:hypothetical protein
MRSALESMKVTPDMPSSIVPLAPSMISSKQPMPDLDHIVSPTASLGPVGLRAHLDGARLVVHRGNDMDVI